MVVLLPVTPERPIKFVVEPDGKILKHPMKVTVDEPEVDLVLDSWTPSSYPLSRVILPTVREA